MYIVTCATVSSPMLHQMPVYPALPPSDLRPSLLPLSPPPLPLPLPHPHPISLSPSLPLFLSFALPLLLSPHPLFFFF